MTKVKATNGALRALGLQLAGKPLCKAGGGLLVNVTSSAGGNRFQVEAPDGEIPVAVLKKAAAKEGITLKL